MPDSPTIYAKLDKHLGLHQDLEVIYVVGGFEAKLANEEAYQGHSPFEFVGWGETIEAALSALNAALPESE